MSYAIPQEEHAERMRLYNQGLNDREIAEILSYTSANIYQWRKKNGLPANFTANKKKVEIDYAKMDELLISGEMSMYRIARELGCSKSVVIWRRDKLKCEGLL